MAGKVVRFDNTEFNTPRPIFVNPMLVSAVSANEHGVTYLQTLAGRVLIKESPEEALAMLGLTVEGYDPQPEEAAPSPLSVKGPVSKGGK